MYSDDGVLGSGSASLEEGYALVRLPSGGLRACIEVSDIAGAVAAAASARASNIQVSGAVGLGGITWRRADGDGV